MSQDLPSPNVSKSSIVAAGVGIAGAASLGAAGMAELIPSEKLLELGMGGASLVTVLFVVTRFLSHLRSEGAANRTTLDGLGRSFAVFADRVEDKIERHAQEMRSLIDRPAPSPPPRGGRVPHLHIVRPSEPERPSQQGGSP